MTDETGAGRGGVEGPEEGAAPLGPKERPDEERQDITIEGDPGPDTTLPGSPDMVPLAVTLDGDPGRDIDLPDED